MSQSTICQKCGRENRATARFCSSCGTPLTREEEKPLAPPPVSEGPQEGLEAARKLWDWTKTVVTVGARTAWNELVNPPPVAQGEVTEKVKLDAAMAPSEPSFFVLVAGSALLMLMALTGNWLAPLTAGLVTLVLSWLRWRRPYFSPLAWQSIAGIFGKSPMVPALHFRLKTDHQDVLVAAIGPFNGPEPAEGDRVKVWGIYDDKDQTRLRAWMIVKEHPSDPAPAPFTVPRLFPFIPVAFFVSLAAFAIAVLLQLF
ncbi:MAG: zinc ribbon domain-containing protein [Armatimonadetes bacterium]|nr:zinc ribbon domain-containing protein [Armatimonadota bacterium]MDW8122642.1 zinc ribbon domain-containing protein [Armatimonadota bacterium]